MPQVKTIVHVQYMLHVSCLNFKESLGQVESKFVVVHVHVYYPHCSYLLSFHTLYVYMDMYISNFPHTKFGTEQVVSSKDKVTTNIQYP